VIFLCGVVPIGLNPYCGKVDGIRIRILLKESLLATNGQSFLRCSISKIVGQLPDQYQCLVYELY
jgi:hypothetical protein